ncbi:hypothetical protein F4560_007719 [Saccharothrix ecbatanensis]|uniref:Fibronectin type-III domain-containing protein n=1 Tax=Saccharothrix ecbatanensis TaxID=1105145 RepID=A0A7W9HTN1_9PSEU|nr:hypothetical protein [Saccharothrix ecbatanensis]MBB5807951.1 hypothetical protein [Saccharothrix ecbatanensis]
MTGWRFDANRFVAEVLKPVQDGLSPDEDLFRVYLLPHEVTDRGTIETALAEVGRQFTQQQYRGFRRAVDILRGQHEAASETLLDRDRREAHRAWVEERRRKLAATIESRLHGAPGLPLAEVNAQARALKVPRSAIVAALREHGADEREPVELPRHLEPGQWAEARGHLAQLGHESLWNYLAGLGGLRTTERHLAARREKLRVSRSSDSNAETTLLRLVHGWLDDLVGVLRHEVVSHLLDRAAYGYAEAVEAARAVADRLRAVGIDADPAAVAYAVWCDRRFTTVPAEPSWQEHYQQAVRDLRLRTALTVLQQQPSLPDEWSRRRTALERQLAELDAEVARCRELERTDVEAAVAGYHRVRAVLADDGIDTALERCRPAAPPTARAEVRDGRVVVTWEPSSATAGRVTYRVSRGDTVLGEDIAAGELVDPDPPNGTALVYAVHALRDGNPSARAARTGPVTVLGEVLDLVLRGGSDAVSGRWRLPEGAVGALVTRSGVAVGEAHSSSFVDHDVRPGETYDYRVRARYRLPDGSAPLSLGVVATASCQEVPVGVTDLVAEFDRDDLVARWTPPARGDVELLELRPGDDPPEPGVVSAHQARRHGAPVPAGTLTGRGVLRGRLSTPGKRQTLVPVTVLGELAAIGTPFVVDARHAAVSTLRLDRLGTTVRVTWEWPRGATAARVVWRKSAEPAGPTDPLASFLDVTKVGYDSRGVAVPVSEGDHWFGVCTAQTVDGVPSFGPLVLRRESTRRTARYSVHRAGVFPRRRWVLTVEGDEQPSSVVLVGKSGIRPMDRDDGEVLLRVDGDGAAAGRDFAVPRHLRRPVHLRAFSLDDRVVLVPVRSDHLIVRGA